MSSILVRTFKRMALWLQTKRFYFIACSSLPQRPFTSKCCGSPHPKRYLIQSHSASVTRSSVVQPSLPSVRFTYLGILVLLCLQISSTVFRDVRVWGKRGQRSSMLLLRAWGQWRDGNNCHISQQTGSRFGTQLVSGKVQLLQGYTLKFGLIETF